MHVVVGATGGTGTALVTELVRRGLPVRTVNRSGLAHVPAGVEVAAGDASDAGRMREVCADAVAVYHCVNPPFSDWRSVFPEAHRSLLAAAGAAGAVLMFADDTWMYGHVDGPMTEDLPSRPVSNLGVLRAWLAEMLLAAHSRGDARVVIGRGGELYGPNVESLLGRNLFGQSVHHHRMFWPGNPDLAITPTYIDDFASGLATLAQEPVSWGEVWHVPSGPPTTGRAFAERVWDHQGRSMRLSTITPAVAAPLGLVSDVVRRGAELLYQFEQDFVVDSTKFTSKFGGTATSYEDGIAATLAWYRRNADRDRHRILPV
ncbi:MAG TPA: NAD-dependent epimerase/dehydratase family protein [Pseudonocardia sp.]|nr:NAD-dependent epimerase/dehydratase family protein [Pseudonocardia sp.]